MLKSNILISILIKNRISYQILKLKKVLILRSKAKKLLIKVIISLVSIVISDSLSKKIKMKHSPKNIILLRISMSQLWQSMIYSKLGLTLIKPHHQSKNKGLLKILEIPKTLKISSPTEKQKNNKHNNIKK